MCRYKSLEGKATGNTEPNREHVYSGALPEIQIGFGGLLCDKAIFWEDVAHTSTPPDRDPKADGSTDTIKVRLGEQMSFMVTYKCTGEGYLQEKK